MRVAVISTLGGFPPWGGAEELWAAMVDEALNKGLDVAVSVARTPCTPSRVVVLRQKGARILLRRPFCEVRGFPGLNRLVRKMLAPFRISPFQDIFRFNPDVVCISQTWTYESIYLNDLLNLLYTASIPYVVVCQYNDEHVPNRATREAAIKFFNRAFRVVFVSHKNLKAAERQLAKTLPNALVLQNPVNLVDLTAVRWPSSGPVCMASVARLDAAVKGQDMLFEVLSSQVWRRRDWRLRLYGEGPDRDYLEALAQHYGISEHINFRGHVKDVRSIWAENHLLVLPSRGEGTPLALIEALLCGRPAVVTDVGGNAEWVVEQQAGFVAEAPTVKSFGAALERAWLAQADWEKMGIRASEYALTKFDKSPGKSLLKVLLSASHSCVSHANATGLRRRDFVSELHGKSVSEHQVGGVFHE